MCPTSKWALNRMSEQMLWIHKQELTEGQGKVRSSTLFQVKFCHHVNLLLVVCQSYFFSDCKFFLKSFTLQPHHSPTMLNLLFFTAKQTSFQRRWHTALVPDWVLSRRRSLNHWLILPCRIFAYKWCQVAKHKKIHHAESVEPADFARTCIRSQLGFLGLLAVLVNSIQRTTEHQPRWQSCSLLSNILPFA